MIVELLDLGEELGLCWVVTLLLGGAMAAQNQSGTSQTQSVFVLRDGHLEVLLDLLLAGELQLDLEGTEALGTFTLTSRSVRTTTEKKTRTNIREHTEHMLECPKYENYGKIKNDQTKCCSYKSEHIKLQLHKYL